MADRVMKNNRIYNKGDQRETLQSEKETTLWKNLETIEKRRKEELAIRLAASENKDLKKLQDENAKLKIKVKELESLLAEKPAPKKEKGKTDEVMEEKQDDK